MILSVNTAEPVVLIKRTRPLERICYLPFYGFGNLFCRPLAGTEIDISR